MRIIHACFSKGFGGLEIFPIRLCKRLMENKNIKVLLLLKENTKQFQEAKKHRLNVIGLKSFQVLKLIKTIKDFKPDIVHLHRAKDIFIFSPLKIFFNFKIIWTNHMGSSFKKRNPLHYLMYKGIGKILILAENNKLREKMGEAAKRILGDRFSLGKHIEKIISLYEELLIKKALVIQIKRMGDCINTEPVIKAIKEECNSNIHFLVDKEFSSLFENNPYIDKILIYNRKFPLFTNLRILRERYDFVFDFLTNPRSQITTFLSFSKNRIGFKRGYHFVYSKKILPFKKPEYIVKRKFHLLRFLNINYNGEIPKIYLKDVELNSTTKILSSNTFIGIAPYSRRITRRWKKEKFVYVIKKILEDKKDLNIMIFLGPDERDYGMDIIELAGSKRVILCPLTSIRIIASLISKMKVILTLDNGLKHIAIARNIPTFTLYFANNPLSWMPPDSKIHRFIQTPSHCRVCEKKMCYDLRCQDELKEDFVYEKFKEFLSELNI